MWPIFYVSPHELRIITGDGRVLVVLSGYAVYNLHGTGLHWHPVTGLMVRGPVWRRLDAVVPIISLASISNDGNAINAGWAVNWCNWTEVLHRIYLKFGLAVRDSDGYLLRVAYHITAVGILK